MENKPNKTEALETSGEVASYDPTRIKDVERQHTSPGEELPEAKYDMLEKTLTFFSILLCIITFPLSLLWMLVVIRQFERALVLRHGKVHKTRAVGPGLICHVPCVDSLRYMDLRVICFAVPPQEALTKDSLTVTVDAVVYYKICNEVYAILKVADYGSSTRLLAATTLRNCIGGKNLREFLVDRSAIGTQVLQEMDKITDRWGIKVTRVDIKDIRLPYQLQKTMATEAESSRLANAKIMVAKAEIEASKSLQKASIILSENPMCMQLRYLQSLHTISGDHTKTIVFPFSTDCLRKIFK